MKFIIIISFSFGSSSPLLTVASRLRTIAEINEVIFTIHLYTYKTAQTLPFQKGLQARINFSPQF